MIFSKSALKYYIDNSNSKSQTHLSLRFTATENFS